MKHETDTVVRLRVIAPTIPDSTPIPLVSEADAAPRPLSPEDGLLVMLLLSLGVWGVILAIVVAIIGSLQ